MTHPERGQPVSLEGMYPGGLLREGPILERTDEKIVAEPHFVTLTEAIERLGGSEERQALLEHLAGFWAWFCRATAGDIKAELWLRGNLAGALSLPAETVDLVAIHGPDLRAGDDWLLNSAFASPLDLPPYDLVVTPLRHDAVEHAFDRARQAVHSRVRVRNAAGDAEETGWLSIMLQGGGAA